MKASARFLWDERNLYVGVDVRDALLRSSDTERDSHLWKQDCVELMVDPAGDGKHYFEIQVSPRGVLFDTRFDAPRRPSPFGHVRWSSEAQVAVFVLGKLDDDEADAGYSVEMAIPWQTFSLDEDPSPLPAVGDMWRANVYVMDLTRKHQQAAAWSPVGTADFHVPLRFGILIFEGSPEDMLGTNEPSTAREGVESPGDGH